MAYGQIRNDNTYISNSFVAFTAATWKWPG